MSWASAEVREVWKCIAVLHVQLGGPTKAERCGTALDIQRVSDCYVAWRDYRNGALTSIVNRCDVDNTRRFLARAKMFATAHYSFVNSAICARVALALRRLDKAVGLGERQLQARETLERLRT